MYHFIPAVAHGELRIADEAITLALTGKPSQDSSLWVHHETGELRITAPEGIGSEQEWQENIQRRVIAGLALTKALAAGLIKVLVQSEAGALCRVDRTYWFKANIGTEGAVQQFDDIVPQAFVGRPILVDMAEAEEWRKVIETALSENMTRVSVHAPEESGSRAEKWTRMMPREQQLQVMKFFATADNSTLLPGGKKAVSWTRLRDIYVKEWVNNPKAEKRGAALTRDPFEKWLRRYLDGWRAPGKGQVGWQRVPQ